VSNQSNDFNTPPELVEPIKAFFGGIIDLDPCSNKTSLVKAEVELMLPTDSLKVDWLTYMGLTKTVFVNPPYAPYYLSDDGTQCLTAKQYKDLGCCDLGKPEGFTRYSIIDWLRKCRSFYLCNIEAEVVVLLPARGMGSTVWQQVILPFAHAICFLKKRVPFWENGGPCKGPNGKVASGTFDCALVYFGLNYLEFKSKFSPMGYVIVNQ
jgi:hypothetical protein